ncbi:MAG: hypothetical protein C5B54_11310 [Acidobacteria bacterium]|nr:MAG: hypothetical protein C5B54_11310 [Acidobacteriota bacterium]
MKILMIAPEPFFEPRGTPFSEYFRIKALLELGHEVDLVTYPIGKDVEMKGLSIYRSAKPPFIKNVKVGPSVGKLYLDFFLFFTVLKLLFKNKYDAIHTHEEACFIGMFLCKLWRIPHVYDMHSSLAQQFANFNLVRAPWVHRILQFFEKQALKSSDAIIAICPYLDDHVKSAGIKNQVFVIENTPEAETFFKRPTEKAKCFKDKQLVLYAGTFEAYQGLDLLLESIPLVLNTRKDVAFLMIGGDRASIERFEKRAAELGVNGNLKLMEKVPVEDVSQYLAAADVLVSPRKEGTNTPLKIYSYLRSGKPIVATNLVTHTQVLTKDIAILTDPTPQAFAGGILEALENPAVGGMVERARQLSEEKYSYREYLSKTSKLYSFIEERIGTA